MADQELIQGGKGIACIMRHDSHVINHFTLNKTDNVNTETNNDNSNSITLYELAKNITEIFSKENICIEDVQKLLSTYDTQLQQDWRDYVAFDDFKYTRNLVDVGNEKFELMLIGWGEDQQSSIHDHAGSHCFMKVVDGSVEESLYEWPQDNDSNNMQFNNDSDNDKNMKLKQPKKIHSDGTLYINDSIGLHRIANPSLTKKAVTLHIYSPPISECHRFDEKTGHKYASGKCTFFSKSEIDINGEQMVKL